MKALTILVVSLSLMGLTHAQPKYNTGNKLYPSLQAYLQNAEKDFKTIPKERKEQLQKVALYINTKLNTEKKVSLLFICTHNSRRSHMGQLWATAAAEYYGIIGVNNYSGGTEMTAFNERAVKSMVKAGFVITKTTEDANPKYASKYGEGLPEIISFSKKYTDEPNPTSNYAAIMTCSQADKNCPIVYGATARILVPYDDPKEADGKPNETQIYDERCKQIATEILYTFSLLKLKNNPNALQ
jgi:protein-tyrosine-phosphatase